MKNRFRRLDTDMLVDTKRMHEDPPFFGHCGLFDWDIHRFVYHKNFKRWLGDVREFIDGVENDIFEKGIDKRVVNLVCVCKAGRNRSVSAKYVLNQIFESLGYATNHDDGHLSKGGWPQIENGICYTCERCTTQTELKSRAILKAYRTWQEVGP